ncbi:hypothetical protein MPTK1_1g13110 [Marchantia polymorpha subsp. ruderalis]|nr:hypothetical protein MARPO_0019s0081 [Marchantia polymorpha]BBM98388.1 hypothetical protein Mp_1g13110 [Marchantia polymorpha subsp. ruderalis]|eukprot:PTQ44657.1 hypothetical protein MARPO_0019s0081 [Marchantia polymorpha]
MVSIHILTSTRIWHPSSLPKHIYTFSTRTASHSWGGQCRVQEPRSGEGIARVTIRRRIFCPLVPVFNATTSMADSSEDPKSFKYMQLWASQDGETHIKECKMKGFDLQKYSSELQFVKTDFGGQPQKIIFTELSAGLRQPLHPCPEVQFVITLSGSWYIETTDGSRYEFQPGEVLFQDNTKNSPADKTPQHFSGAVGDLPCQQFIIQFDRSPEVDNPEPF